MKCVHCGYTFGWCIDTQKDVKPKYEDDYGDFFYSEMEFMRRSNSDSWRPDERRKLIACPKCRKVFITD